ncbi:MAG: cysteine desulfurase family protein [Patescibacteria group bacterium]|nr:cysteine desulfurase family protein [Patescibacteria group bacterium]
MKKIYLDHSATTPVDKAVLKAMEPYWLKNFGNSSSLHSFGQEAIRGVDKARKQCADYFKCESAEITFTSGATEANNLAIKGLFKAFNSEGYKNKNLHAITSIVEHDAVLEPFMELEKSGTAITHLPVNKVAVVEVEKLIVAIQENTVLVSIMWVNSEIGSIMPIKKLAKAVYKERERRTREWKKLGKNERTEKPLPIYFHTDATQAVNFFDCNIKDNYIDLLSFSGHKIYGPKGVGALFVRDGIRLEALQRGGHHEKNLRSGTLNVSGIVGLGAAVSIKNKKLSAQGGPALGWRIKNNEYIGNLRDRLVKGVKKNIPDVVLNTNRDVSTPAHAHFSFIGIEGEALLLALDLEGIAVSTGSACASGSLKAPHVLIAMGIDKEIANYSIRFSLGKFNTKEEINIVIEKLVEIVKRLRKMNPIYKNI